MASSPRARKNLEQVSLLDPIFVLHTPYDLDFALQDLVRLILFSDLKPKKATMKSALSQRAFSQRAIHTARMKMTELRARAVRQCTLSFSFSLCAFSFCLSALPSHSLDVRAGLSSLQGLCSSVDRTDPDALDAFSQSSLELLGLAASSLLGSPFGYYEVRASHCFAFRTLLCSRVTVRFIMLVPCHSH